MTHEVFVALRRRRDEVCTPYDEVAWEVFRRIRIFGGKRQLLIFKTLGYILLHAIKILAACSSGFIKNRLTGFIERRVRRQPAKTCGQHIVVAGVFVTRTMKRRYQVIHVHFVGAPLVRCEIEEGRTVLQLRCRLPILGGHNRTPAFGRTELFLPYIVGPAAAILAFAGTEHNKIEHGTVDNIRMEPVINTGAHDDHGAAARSDSIVRKFASRMDNQFRINTGIFFLPSRRKRCIS